jgi:hypothetical protein
LNELTLRLQRVLGLSRAEAELLAKRARLRLGRRGFQIRALAFALATAPVLRRLIPGHLRLRAITPLLHALLPGPSENLLYARARPLGDEDRRDA